MSSFLQRYKTDKNLEENGVWVDFGDVRVKIARITSKRSRDVRRQLERKYARKFRGQDIPHDVMEKILIEQLAQAVVMDWKGVTDASGREIPFNTEAARSIFTEFPDFREDVASAALMKETFLEEAREEELGNSQNTYSGN